MIKHAAIATISSLALAGCVHSRPAASGYAGPPGEVVRAKPSTPPPNWVMNPPTSADALYALGISGPTFYPEDAVKYAAENGRAELGRNISSNVTSALLAVATNEGTTVDTAYATQVTHDYSEGLVENSQVVATWIDRSGSYSGVSGTTYALVKIDKSKLPAVKAAAK